MKCRLIKKGGGGGGRGTPDREAIFHPVALPVNYKAVCVGVPRPRRCDEEPGDEAH